MIIVVSGKHIDVIGKTADSGDMKEETNYWLSLRVCQNGQIVSGVAPFQVIVTKEVWEQARIGAECPK